MPKIRKRHKKHKKNIDIPRRKKQKKRTTNNNIQTYVYLLISCTNTTRNYIGVTNNLCRRLDQHNGVKAGGAKYTRSYRPWRFYAVFKAPDRRSALMTEWKAKHRKSKNDGVGIDSKVNCICRHGSAFPTFTRIL